MSSLSPLPIDAVLSEVLEAWRSAATLVLEAPPGAGKTTRVPRALLDESTGNTWVLEPRRLAARLSALRVAQELGEPIGGRIGYQVRFDEAISQQTRVRFVTEGLLTRRLVTDPLLRDVHTVVLDEFHERHLDGDIALAFLRRLQATTRPDLRLIVMSATLDAGGLARSLECPVIRSEGRRFEVAIEHAALESTRPLAQQVAGAVERLVAAGLDGDVLVFLPGVAEIRRAAEACAGVAEAADLAVVTLHGELPPAEQDLALRPQRRRKVILSTNVAETSVTIDGVVAVIDSGLVRQAGHSPWTGFPTLQTVPTSQASAIQRAGRAGRTRPGRCVRLYTRGDFEARRAHDVAEVRRLDLAGAVLDLRVAGVDPAALPWFEAPSAPALEAADTLLRRLEAIDANGTLTDRGRQMSRFPLHPRLSALVCEGQSRGVGRAACALAALLSERDIRVRSTDAAWGGSTVATDSDPVSLFEEFAALVREGIEAHRCRARGFELGAVRSADRVRQQLERVGRVGADVLSGLQAEQALQRALLAAFPDRVARRRVPGGKELVFAEGGAGQLSEASGVRSAEWMVAVEAEEKEVRSGTRSTAGVQIRQVSAVAPEWLLDRTEDIQETEQVTWNADLGRVEVASRLRYGQLTLDEDVRTTVRNPAVSARLAAEALALGPGAWVEDPERWERVLARCSFAATERAELRERIPQAANLRPWLERVCAGRGSLRELREADLVGEVLTEVGGAHRLDQWAPESLLLAGGRKVKIEYPADGAPWVASRLQDFFGSVQGPSIGGGRTPLVLHLLAPNHRAVQVTRDLAGFWDRHYPAIRKELMRQYPRHAWPEDPRTATPPIPKGGYRH